MSYLVDTNVISEFARKNPSKNVISWFNHVPEESLFLSVLTIGEIRKGIEKLKDQTKKNKLRIWLEHKIPDWFQDRILPINIETADHWGRLQGQTKNPLPVTDSLLAATALHYDLTLVTRNVVDFQFNTLEVMNPWEFNN